MSDMYIRNVDEDLMRRAKASAALAGLTLRDYMIGLLRKELGVQTKSTRSKKSRKQ